MINREEIFDELRDIVLDYLGDDDIAVTEDSSLADDLELTSLDMMSIVGDAEDSFGISFEDEAMSGINTVGDAVDYIVSKKEI